MGWDGVIRHPTTLAGPHEEGRCRTIIAIVMTTNQEPQQLHTITPSPQALTTNPRMTTQQHLTNHTPEDTVHAASAAVVLSSSSLSPSCPGVATATTTPPSTPPSHQPDHTLPKTNQSPRKSKKWHRHSKKKNKRAGGTTTSTTTPLSCHGPTSGTSGTPSTAAEATIMFPYYDYSYDYYYCEDQGTNSPTTMNAPRLVAANVDYHGSHGNRHDIVTVHSSYGEPFEIHAVLGHGYYDQYYPFDLSSSPLPTDAHQHPCAVVYTCSLSHCGTHLPSYSPAPHTSATATNAVNTTAMTGPGGSHSGGGGGWPEFIVFDVPLEKIDPLRNLLLFLVQQMEQYRFVKGGEIVESDGLVLEASWIVDPLLRWKLHQRFPFLAAAADAAASHGRSSNSLPRRRHHHAHQLLPASYSKLLNLKPRFPLEENQLQGYYTTRREWVASTLWGCRPPAPGEQTALRDAIVDTFTTQLILPSRFLAWHIDGNPNNNGTANLQAVTIGEALAHPTWYVDWWKFLHGNLDMISYVRMNLKHFAHIFRLRSGSKIFTEFDFHRIRFHPPTSTTTATSSMEDQNVADAAAAAAAAVPGVVPPCSPILQNDRTTNTTTPKTTANTLLKNLLLQTPLHHDKTDPSPPSTSSTTSDETYTSPTTVTTTTGSPDSAAVAVVGIHHSSTGHCQGTISPSPPLPAMVTPPSSKLPKKDRGGDDNRTLEPEAPGSPPFS